MLVDVGNIALFTEEAVGITPSSSPRDEIRLTMVAAHESFTCPSASLPCDIL